MTIPFSARTLQLILGGQVLENMIALSVRHFVEAWKLICTVEPNHALKSRPGLEMVFSGVPNPFFNVGFATEPIASSAQLDTLTVEAKAFASQSPVPWFFALTNDLIADGIDVDGMLARHELVPVMKLTGMIADEVAPLAALPEDLELELARDEASCKALMAVNGAAYGMDLASLDVEISRPDFWKRHTPVVGKVGGNPVSCAAVLTVDNHHFVAFVATHPDHQRRGFADAAMRRALELAAETNGPKATTLHATEAGRPVYERMGYRSIATHTMYLEQKFTQH